MEQKYKVGDLVRCAGVDAGPYEITEVVWSPNFGGWIYNAKAPQGVLYGAGQLSLDPWEEPAAEKPRVCDCGAVKARTTHASWCSTLNR
jgi:hypothetical protein